MIRIAQAASSEDFSNYGIAPNQRRTGVTKDNPGGNMDGELNVVAWYGPWEKVYRPVDPAVAEKIAWFMERAVANGSHIGYSWSGNTGVYDVMAAKGTDDPMDIDTPVNTDCAAIEGAAIEHAGVHHAGLRTLTTWKMDSVLGATKAFSVLTTKELCESGKGIQRGDILWKTGHTAVAIDTDTSDLLVKLDKDGLRFLTESGSVRGNYPNDVKMDGLFYFERFNFYGVSIAAGTIGTRGAQMSKVIAKAGYRPVVARLTYVSDSSLANVAPFFGNGDNDKTLHVNFYRATRSACKVDAGVLVVYVRNEVLA